MKTVDEMDKQELKEYAKKKRNSSIYNCIGQDEKSD